MHGMMRGELARCNMKYHYVIPLLSSTDLPPKVTCPLTCPPKPGPGIMLEFLTKEDGIWPGKDEHQNRL